MATVQEIEAKKQELHSKGIASYRINGMDENESIARMIDESWSCFFVCVRDPYFDMKGKAGNMRFRTFQTIKDKPQIPMGYSGAPLFMFECYDGEPQKKAVAILKSRVKNKYYYSIKDDEITCKKIVPEGEKVKKKVYAVDIKEGQTLFVNWTNSHTQYKAKCEIIRVNRSSARVKLLETAGKEGEYGFYPVGQEIVINRKQTQQNCLTTE